MKITMEEGITMYRDRRGDVYLVVNGHVYLDGVLKGSPVVGHTTLEHADAVHHRVRGYESFIRPGVRRGRCLVRDNPSARPYAGVSDPIVEIRRIRRKRFSPLISEQTLVDRIMASLKK